MAQWTAEQWKRVSAHLDRALELDGPAREVWISELERQDAEIGRQLRELLETHDANSAAAFLEYSPLSEAADYRSYLVGRQFGSYRVLSLLGHGGMGSVWLAERADGLFTRRVALKLIHPALVSRLMTERFSREREILASLNHPSITRLIDAGFAADEQPYLALEYVDGRPITDYCDECRIPIRERLQLLQQVLSAVQYAHAHLVIHRDLKPSNILVTQNGHAHLLDFGIAKLLNEGEAKETELTRLGGRALTPDYAAPEQIAGAPITTATDVYALGVLLYEILTGERPYKLKHDSPRALEEAILHTEPISLGRAMVSEAAAAARATTVKKLSTLLRGDLGTIAVKALKKSPTDRYATANAFDEDIARFLRGDVVLARRDSLAYRVRKFMRRHRLGIAVAGVLMATLIGGLGATSYEARVAGLQRDAAVQAQLRSLTQTADARLKQGEVSSALGIILEVLRNKEAVPPSLPPGALNVFQEALAADPLITALTGHTDRVRSAAFSPDGTSIVTASSDQTARIWDAATGVERGRLNGHAGAIRAANFSADGRRIVTASRDGTARIWDAVTGRQILTLRGHTARVQFAAFSRDGQRVVTASLDKSVRIWDAATGEQKMILSGHTGRVNWAVFSPDDRRIVTASEDKTARIWDAALGRQIMLFAAHTDGVSSAEFSPDGQRIVSASVDKTARVWDTATGQEVAQLRGHTQLLQSAAFSPDGQRVVTASDDHTARIWDAGTGRETMLLIGPAAVGRAAFSPDGQRVVTASDDMTARVWDASMNRALKQLTGHTQRVSTAMFSPDGQRIVTASYDLTARVWDAATGRQMLLLGGHSAPVASAAYSPDGQDIVTASFDATTRIWNSTTGQQMLLIGGQKDRMTWAAFSPDGQRIVTSSNDRTARIWETATGREVTVLNGHSDSVTWAAFSPDGRRVVTASFDKTARIWDSATGRQIMLLAGTTDAVESALFSADGRRVVTASDDKMARIWDATTGLQLVALSGHRLAVSCAEFSPDGRRVVTASADGTARLWDAATGEQLKVFYGHGETVENAFFSPDGQRVLTASDDKTARVWDAEVSTIDTQIKWAEASQFDPLPINERYQLGLPPLARVRQWPLRSSQCDESAAAPYDPDRRARGVLLGRIVGDIAIPACAGEISRSGYQARSAYQHGRALFAVGHFLEARQYFENAVAHGIRAAQIDLGMLHLQPSAAMVDLPRAISLYEHAWQQGVAIAAFELGSLYENGASRSGSNTEYLLVPDNARAWSWYQKAAEAGEPNALARFAVRNEGTASSTEDTAKRKALWLRAFRYYAAAAERARGEEWPDDAWRNWRYRRASLARLLAREGMELEVAEAYESVLDEYAPPRSTRWFPPMSFVSWD